MVETSTKHSKDIKQVLVPDIGDYKNVPVIEVMVKAGDKVTAEQSLLTLETDKATMDIPAPFDGKVLEVKIKVGDKISQGGLLLLLETSTASAAPIAPTSVIEPPEPIKPAIAATTSAPTVPRVAPASTAPQLYSSWHSGEAHASPSVRRFARELGVNLASVQGSGAKGRATKSDVQNFVKAALTQPQGGLQVLAMPVVDFAKFGAIETKPLSRIKKISGANLHRNWVTIPHITQHDEADITDMEALRKKMGEKHAQQGIKITPLAFILKALVEALRKFPDFNASLDASGENLVLKNYFHIGVAVDTPEGLMVPVLRDVNQKDLVQLAAELAQASARAREKKLSATEMQGGCFTVTSLGGIGGTAFTPIINAPEVAILGVSRASIKPVYQDGNFIPRLILPMSLSYDHRVIDGASAVRFTTYLGQVLADGQRLAS